MARRGGVPRWFLETAVIAIGANLLASYTTGLTIDLMRRGSALAREPRVHELALLPWFRLVAYAVLVPTIVAYLWPIAHWVPGSASERVPPWVQGRVVSAPLVVALLGFTGWIASIVVFPLATVLRTGRWSPDLMSQQILAPLLNGFLAATTTYLLVDLVFRRPGVRPGFPERRLSSPPGLVPRPAAGARPPCRSHRDAGWSAPPVGAPTPAGGEPRAHPGWGAGAPPRWVSSCAPGEVPPPRSRARKPSRSEPWRVRSAASA